jgi:hypothetical protein
VRRGVRSLKSECDEIGVRRWRGAGSVVEEEGAARGRDLGRLSVGRPGQP